MATGKISPCRRILYAPLGFMLAVASHMPLRLLYLLSDLLAFAARSLVRYRRRIVRLNVQQSYPQLPPERQRRIERGFYRHFCDYFVETVKFPAMSARQMRRRMAFEGMELIEEAARAGRQVLIYTSHYGNWEWTTSIPLWCRHPEIIFAHIYRPLNDPWFDRYFLRIRSRFNTSVPMKSAMRSIARWRAAGRLSVTGFLSDQKPDLGSRTYTVPFLSRPTPFIGGTEEIARRFGMTVLYFDVEMLARGRYRNTLRLISPDASAEQPGEITRRYAALLENTINRRPEAYLWSHNRWRLPRK